MSDEVTLKPPLEFIRFPGKIHLITTDHQMDEVADALLAATELGFDTETRPSFRKGEVYKVALLQLATDTDAYLVRLHGLTRFEAIKRVFENELCLKVGVAIRDDLKGLQKLFPFTPKNFVELQELAKKKGLQNMGLKGMTEEVLGAGLSKAAKTTNWEARALTDPQLVYAATDAWIGLKLHQKISVPPTEPV